MITMDDGSKWIKMSASRLSIIPIWKGNRIIDQNHTARINNSISSIQELAISPYRIVLVKEDGIEHRYIVDGQHRVQILKRYFTNHTSEDFNVLVNERECFDESSIIEYFKVINTTKSIQWKEDPILVANKYIDLFTKEFNKDIRKPLIKTGKTNRPYLSIDKLRDVLISKNIVDWKTTPEEFVIRCREINDQQLNELDLKVHVNKRAKDLGFSLGVIEFSWI